MKGGIDRPDRAKRRTIREHFREDPGLWGDVGQAFFIFLLVVVIIVEIVRFS
jgi:hypothetical protein